MEYYRKKSVVRTDAVRAESGSGGVSGSVPEALTESDGTRSYHVTATEIADIVRAVLSEMRIYVLESDITEAQNGVKAVVEQSIF